MCAGRSPNAARNIVYVATAPTVNATPMSSSQADV
jgi:hypothetical protein